MLKPSDFNNAVPQFQNGNYASNPINPQYVEEPSSTDYNRGTEPLQTLPAQWWNWFINKFTSRFNKVNIYVKNLFNELTQLLSLVNVTPDGTEGSVTDGQLKNAFEELYPGYINTKLDLENTYVKKTQKVNGHALAGDISVTKSDVGLGNVPNVTTNNQTPTYTAASSLTNLTSGEVLSTAFGKIAKAISSLILHINNTSNPHSVNKTQVGLGNVVNTGDSATPASGGTDKFTTGGAYTELAKKTDVTTFEDATTATTHFNNAPYTSRVTDYDRACTDKIVGASFAVNQLVKNGNFASTSSWTLDGATLSVSNGVASVTGNATSGSGIYQDYRASNGHKLLFMMDIKTQEAGTRGAIVYFGNTAEAQYPFATSSTSFESFSFCASATSSGTYFRVRLRVQTGGDTNQYRNVMIIDLTQMFGSAIADRIYAMEQATEGSGIAWIKSFGFFNKDYYSTDEGSIQNVKPSAHKVSASVVKWFTSRNVSTQYLASLYAEAVLKPNTNYTLYVRGANGAGVYPNEYIFTTNNSFTLDGSLQSVAVTTRTELPYNSSTRLNSGWTIFKNRTGNTVIPAITEFYIVEEGANADPTFSQSIPFADTELRGIPKLDSNNNLYFDGDIYYPNGDVIRKYGVATISDFTGNHLNTASGGGLGYIDTSDSVLGEVVAYVVNNFNLPTKNGNAGWNSTEPCIAILGSGNGNRLRIYETLKMTLAQFQVKYANLQIVYKKLTPTSEIVAGYTNPHTLIKKGIEEFVDNRTIPLPTGHETEYVKLPSWLSNNVIFL